jgi:hypothetical protein
MCSLTCVVLVWYTDRHHCRYFYRVGRGELDVFEFDAPESSFSVVAYGGHVVLHDSNWGVGGAASRQPAAIFCRISSGKAGSITSDLVKLPDCSTLEYGVLSEEGEWMTRSATIDGALARGWAYVHMCIVIVLCALFVCLRVCACNSFRVVG